MVDTVSETKPKVFIDISQIYNNNINNLNQPNNKTSTINIKNENIYT